MEDLKRKLMDEIGLYVDNHGFIVDQDTMQPLKFKTKNLRYDTSKGFRRGDTIFDPIGKTKQMKSLLEYAVQKDDIAVKAYSNITNKDGKYICSLRLDDSTISSRPYDNPALSYADAILLLYDNDMDLSEYDITEEDK